MMAERKTIPIAMLKEHANRVCAKSVGPNRADRQAVISFVSGLLMEANAYKGFNYLPSEFEGDGTSRLRRDCDETRVFFY